MIAPRFLRDPQRFNSIEASIAESSDLKVCWVFMGLDHAEGEKNRRATVGTNTVGFDDTTLGAACPAFSIPENLTGKDFDSFGTVESLLLQSLGSFDPVGVGVFLSGLCGVHSLNRALIARRSPQFPVETPGKSGTKEMLPARAVGRDVD